jgi:hypothetical protein
MSDLRIGVVAEGPTDLVVIEAALRSILPCSFIATLLQPEESSVFGPPVFGSTGAGWGGVYRWCDKVVRELGSLGAHRLLFANFDALVLHLDADVATHSYSDANIAPKDADGALPCARPCPPVEDGADAVRSVLLSWIDEGQAPPKTVLCVPSMCTESWVLAALFPEDPTVQAGVECLADPEAHLARQPKKARVRKARRDYESHRQTFTERWPGLASTLSQARRFDEDVRRTILSSIP